MRRLAENAGLDEPPPISFPYCKGTYKIACVVVKGAPLRARAPFPLQPFRPPLLENDASQISAGLTKQQRLALARIEVTVPRPACCRCARWRFRVRDDVRVREAEERGVDEAHFVLREGCVGGEVEDGRDGAFVGCSFGWEHPELERADGKGERIARREANGEYVRTDHRSESVGHNEQRTSKFNKESCDVKYVCRIPRCVVVHLIRLPRLVLHDVQQDIYS